MHHKRAGASFQDLLEKYGNSPRGSRHSVSESGGDSFPFMGEERIPLRDLHRWILKEMGREWSYRNLSIARSR